MWANFILFFILLFFFFFQGWYCKRPKTACPLHYEKDHMLGENVDQICGYRRSEEVFFFFIKFFIKLNLSQNSSFL